MNNKNTRMSSSYIDALAAELQKANWAYHNTGDAVLGDDVYDRKLEELKRLSPTHPFLSVIGAPPTGKNTVYLPYIMASLDKVRHGENALSRFLGRTKSKQYLVSEKLDGLSMMYVNNRKRSLYLRGDGVKGVDVSRVSEKLAPTLPQVKCVIRGEVILPLSQTPEGSIGRSLVNGWLHRLDTTLPDELKLCHFIAYQVIEPAGMTRIQQIEWLKVVSPPPLLN